ncbi:Hypothetical protein NocV09_11000080 [Nannochloropsis oceanica]
MDFLVYILARLQACMECLKPFLPQETQERLERRQVVERGATFKKRNFTLGGFALQTKKVYVNVKQDEGKLVLAYRQADDMRDRGTEIHAGDMKSIGANGAKSITIISKTGDVLLEIEAAEEEQRDLWLTALNEALLHNFKVASEEGVVLGQPRNFKERAEKELYFQRRHQEIELKKKSTEAKKAKFMREAGGLKYTALHMANRATEGGGGGGAGGGGEVEEAV